jgi:RNA polymerase sigma-70 factor (ECF subfamily)
VPTDPGVTQRGPGTSDDSGEAEESADSAVTTEADERRTSDMPDPAAHAEAKLRVPSITMARPRAQVDAGAREDLITAAYDSYRRELYSMALGATHDADTAADLVQEAFLRLVREVQAGRVPDNMRAWLYRVVTNLITTRWRRTSVADRFKALFAVGTAADDPAGEFLRRESATELHRALRTLPLEARTALMLSAQGLSGREIAAAIGRSEGATRTLMCRARITLRERLDEREAGR